MPPSLISCIFLLLTLDLQSCSLAASTSLPASACRPPVSFHRASFPASFPCFLLLASSDDEERSLPSGSPKSGSGPVASSPTECDFAGTGAILAQGTHWALAAKQAFCPCTSCMSHWTLRPSRGLKFCLVLSAAAPLVLAFVGPKISIT